MEKLLGSTLLYMWRWLVFQFSTACYFGKFTSYEHGTRMSERVKIKAKFNSLELDNICSQ